MRHACTPRRRGQTWATFLRNHAKDMWACDFLQVTDVFFRSLFAFFILDMRSRKVIHMGVTRSPSTPGLPNNYGRRLLMDNRRTISFVIVIPSLDPVSRAWPRPWASRCSPRLPMRNAPMRSGNAFWEVCGESVSITCSSSRRSIWTVSCTPISSISIEPDRIKASDNRFQNRMVSQFNQITMVARSSPSRSWVDCTTSIAEVLEL